jgi:Zn-dependent protease
MSVLLVILLYGSILAHEFGHALTARAFGIGTKKIVLHLFGGVALIESEPERPRDEFWITAAGPAVSLALAALFGAGWAAALGLGAPSLFAEGFMYLTLMNAILAIFNCLPGFPMDGGRVLRAALWAMTGDYLFATRLAAWGGVAVGLGLSTLGVFLFINGGSGLLMILLGLFLVYLARLSARQAEVTAAFQGRTVRDFLRPVRAVIPRDMLLSDVAHLYFGRFDGGHFPVVEGDRLLGRLTEAELRRYEPRQWDWVTAREAMAPYEPSSVLRPTMPALKALQQLASEQSPCAAVFEGRRLLGFVYFKDLAQLWPGATMRVVPPGGQR